MGKSRARPYTRALKDLMATKTELVSKARALDEMGMKETAQSLWETAANYEERIAPLLESLGRDTEAAIHRSSAASCYRKVGQFGQAANLFRASLAGPLRDEARQDIEKSLEECLSHLTPSRARQRRYRLSLKSRVG